MHNMGAQAENESPAAERAVDIDDEKRELDVDMDSRDESNGIADEKEQPNNVADSQDASTEIEGSSEPAQEPAQEVDPQIQEQPEYLHGWKLYSVLIAVSLVFFLMLLDIAIVVTVCYSIPFHKAQYQELNALRLFQASPLISTRYLMSAGMVLPTSLRMLPSSH